MIVVAEILNVAVEGSFHLVVFALAACVQELSPLITLNFFLACPEFARSGFPYPK